MNTTQTTATKAMMPPQIRYMAGLFSFDRIVIPITLPYLDGSSVTQPEPDFYGVRKKGAKSGKLLRHRGTGGEMVLKLP